MFGALGKHQHLPVLTVGNYDLGSNRVRSVLVNGKVPEYILNPRFQRQINPRVQCAWRDCQVMRRTYGLRRASAIRCRDLPAARSDSRFRLAVQPTNRVQSSAPHKECDDAFAALQGLLRNLVLKNISLFKK